MLICFGVVAVAVTHYLYWWTRGWIWAALLPLLALPLAVRTVVGVYRSAPGPRFNTLLGRAALTHRRAPCIFRFSNACLT